MNTCTWECLHICDIIAHSFDVNYFRRISRTAIQFRPSHSAVDLANRLIQELQLLPDANTMASFDVFPNITRPQLHQPESFMSSRCVVLLSIDCILCSGLLAQRARMNACQTYIVTCLCKTHACLQLSDDGNWQGSSSLGRSRVGTSFDSRCRRESTNHSSHCACPQCCRGSHGNSAQRTRL